MAGNTNPLRQQMINMMYLVLLALMALNVSAEILKAFEIVNAGITESISSIEKKNTTIMRAFEEKMETDAARTEKYFSAAKTAKKEASSLYKHIEDVKNNIIEVSGGRNEETGELNGAKDTDTPPRIMIDQGKGEELKQMINKTRDEFISILKGVNLKETELAQFKDQMTLKANDPKNDREKRTWAQYRFGSVPVAAAVTLLTKLQNDVKNTEANLLDKLIAQIGATEISFDKTIAIVQMPKTSIGEGETVEANIVLGAYSSTASPKIYVNNDTIPVSAGIGSYTITGSSPGQKSVPGRIEVMNPNTGEVETDSFTIKYDVFKAPAIISADAMKVLYTGLENPISVSVPGYKPSQVSASINNGSLISQGDGKYIAKLSRGRQAVISATITTGDGGKQSAGSETFTVKPVPKPIPVLGNKTSGSISPGQLKITNFVIAKMDESFVFEGVKFLVTKFRFIYKPKAGDAAIYSARGPRLTGPMKGKLANAGKDDLIIIDNIYAKGPDGEVRLPTGISLTVE